MGHYESFVIHNTCLALWPGKSPCWTLAESGLDDHFVSGHSLEPVYNWLVPVVGVEEDPWISHFCSPCLRRGGVNHHNLRPLGQAALQG